MIVVLQMANHRHPLTCVGEKAGATIPAFVGLGDHFPRHLMDSVEPHIMWSRPNPLRLTICISDICNAHRPFSKDNIKLIAVDPVESRNYARFLADVIPININMLKIYCVWHTGESGRQFQISMKFNSQTRLTLDQQHMPFTVIGLPNRTHTGIES